MLIGIMAMTQAEVQETKAEACLQNKLLVMSDFRFMVKDNKPKEKFLIVMKIKDEEDKNSNKVIMNYIDKTLSNMQQSVNKRLVKMKMTIDSYQEMADRESK